MKTLLLLAMGWAVAANGALLKGTGEVAKTIEQVPVYAKADLAAAGGLKASGLKLTGAGVRVKKVLFVKADVYVAASYAEAGATPMAAKTKAITMTFLRDVDAGKIRDSFTGALKKNHVDLESPVIKQAFGKMTFDMKEKQTLTLAGFRKESKGEILVFESPQGTFQVEGETVVSDFWKIWFGEPDDGGLEDLKAKLLGKND
jgi:hypothetical protein